ncbi:D-ribose pyranase [Deinococcus altitudinis]|uniref:D-ribose pyranase n=1 Tax=Deinococcus altitudinis TaxID=468914 RepID=UPI0038923308
MKSSGLLHPDLCALVAAAGHTQRIVLADAGLPIPPGTPRIELGVVAGLPGLLEVLRALLGELAVEGVTLAEETQANSPEWYARLQAVLPTDVAMHEVSHEALKADLPGALAVIRTGEVTPYANVVLHCGAGF